MSSPDYLDEIKVATPCKASWEGMQGDERVRFCSLCRRNVYNISEMSRADATALISTSENRTCIRYYRRRDGTVMTRDCPVGLRALRRRLFVMCSAGVILAISILLASIGFEWSNASRQNGDDGRRLS